MKKSLLAILAFVAVLSLSCKKEPKEKTLPAPSVIEVADLTVHVGGDRGTVEIPVQANYAFEVFVAKDAQEWLFYEETKAQEPVVLEEHKVVLNYNANPIAKERSGIVTIKGTQQSVNIEVVQGPGAPVISYEGGTIHINPRGDTILVPLTSNDDIVATPADSWIHALQEVNGGYAVKFDLNDSGEPREGSVVFSCSTGADVSVTVKFTQKAANTDPNAISILAIGNSFSADAMENLYPILSRLGYTKICLGNLYIGGCSLETHAENLSGGETPRGAYTYYYTENGEWTTTEKFVADTALVGDNWDYITVQQVSGLSGVPSSYDPYLENVIAAVRNYCEFTPILWHMTWAYEGDSTHDDFARYGGVQLDMYAAIVNALRAKVAVSEEIEGVIPSGTAIQNLRTSFMGDNLTRDGYHLSNNIGRLTASLTWAKAITGKDIDTLTYVPAGFRWEEEYLPAIKEAVNNAVAKPVAITAAVKGAPSTLLVPNEDLRAVATAAEYNLDDYVELPLNVIHNAYYNSGSNSTIIAGFTGKTGDANLDVFAATNIVGRDYLPVGTLIVIKDGYQIRPEGWEKLGAKSSARPGVIKDPITVVNGAFVANYNFRAFNINKLTSDGKNATLDADGMKELDSCVSVFVPKAAAFNFGGLEDYGNGEWKWN